ncbi:unnamed protein product [Caenorhabditis brenneri]
MGGWFSMCFQTEFNRVFRKLCSQVNPEPPTRIFDASYMLVTFDKNGCVDVICNDLMHSFPVIPKGTGRNAIDINFPRESPLKTTLEHIVSRLRLMITDKCRFFINFNDPDQDIRDCVLPVNPSEVSRVGIGKPRVSKEELDYLMQQFSHVEFFVFGALPSKALKSFPYGFKQLMIGDDGGLTLEQLQNIKCECLVLMKSNFTSTDINQFLKNWLKKKTPKNLKLLRIHDFEPSIDLFDSLDVQLWNPSLRSQFFPFMGLVSDCSSEAFVDIIRNDGKIGTIYQEAGAFGFSVWDEPFPELPEETVMVEEDDVFLALI